MALSPDDLAYLRSELGAGVDEFELSNAMDRLGTVEAVALEVVQGRLATLLDPLNPARFAVEGYSQDAAANIAALERQATRLRKAIGSSVSFGEIVTSPIR